jgi:hypothetical protein
MPLAAAAERSDPSRIFDVSTSGAPNSRASLSAVPEPGEMRICGRFVRWIAAECRSMPTSQRLTTSSINRFASRRGQRAFCAARKGAVEIAPVRQITRMVQEAESVDDRHGKQRAAQFFEMRRAQKSPHDLDADDLVAMHGGADKHCRSGPRPCTTCTDIVTGVWSDKYADRKVDRSPAACRDPFRPQSRNAVRGSSALSFGLRLFQASRCFPRKSMILPAMSMPVAFSTPSRPGDEFTSMTTGRDWRAACRHRKR